MKYIIAILILISVYACNYPEHYFDTPLACEGKLSIQFEEHTYQVSKVNEIISTSQPSDYRYYFKTFFAIDNTDKMLVNFRNDKVCIDVVMTIEELGRLDGMKKTNGKSYPKELYDLQWYITTNNGVSEVFYVDMHEIID